MSERKPTVGIYTLGCKVNQYESEAIAEECERLGLEVCPPSEVCDAYIINTCSVTAEADRKARQFIRRAIGENSEAYIAVTGCFAQVSPGDIARIEGVDYICGNDKKLNTAHVIADLIGRGIKPCEAIVEVGDIALANFERMSISSFGRTRACVKIEDGCESHCTYCTIPAARGNIRSKSPDEVICEVETLTRGGCHEVVLTGIETASYGRDLGDGVDLASLLCRIDKIENIGRVRLGSLDPSLLKPSFVERIAHLKSLTPHFHISLQSGSDRILALMRRKYNTGMVLDSMENLRQTIPGVQFTTDVIVGFPQESDDDFAQTMEFIDKAGFLAVHVFAYSRRAGTVAASMPGQIPEAVKKQRSASLIAKSKQIRDNILYNVITNSPDVQVLVETFDGAYAYGHTESFIEVRMPAVTHPGNELVNVRLDGVDGDICTGQIIKE